MNDSKYNKYNVDAYLNDDGDDDDEKNKIHEKKNKTYFTIL